MKLLDLDACFMGKLNAAKKSMRGLPSIQGAQAAMFQCPSCAQGKKRGEGFVIGAHYILVCFSNPRGAPVASSEYDDNPRWEMSGTSLDDLTLSPSINCDIPWKDEKGVEHPSSCKFHGFVKNGAVT